MTSDLRPYPKYKDFGDVWLGEVPIHWQTISLGAISLRRSERNRPDLPLLSVLREKGVVLRSSLAEEENHNFIPDDLSNYRVARAGDLVVNKMKAWQGSVGIAPTDGIVSPAYFVFELTGITKEYAHRLLRCRLYADYFARASDGVRIGQWDLSIDQMKRIPVIIPPVEEQREVVRYLDVMDRRIRRFIRNRRRLIEVLNEQKQAIINRAVTRGLDPNAPLKPSGIDWLGDVPAHWDILPIKRLFARMDYGISDSTRDEGRYRVLTMGNIRDGQVTLTNCGRVDCVDASLVLDHHDLLFNRTNSLELVGKVGLFEGHQTDDVTFASYLVRMSTKEFVSPNYANYLLNGQDVLRFVRLHAIPSLHQANLNPTRYGRLHVPLPPFDEQVAIQSHISNSCLQFDAAIYKARREIDLINEYRTRLIADVVTGKVDVRGLAPTEPLPTDGELPEVDEALDDEGMLGGDDEPELVEEVFDAD